MAAYNKIYFLVILKVLNTLLPGRPVQTYNISISLGSIQPFYNYRAKNIHVQKPMSRYSIIRLSKREQVRVREKAYLNSGSPDGATNALASAFHMHSI